eukprot:GHVU01046701.1.p1 GENE.GHVU01046701.1~~GHVU01046701.1.p1  ORF type:complete len:224 (-),score=5.06 GHVU01046701.1:225-896(-)
MSVYGNATEFPHAKLVRNPRTRKNDKYQDNRYVYGFDDEHRMDRLREIFFSAVNYKLRTTEFTRRDFLFSYGPGTPNPTVFWKYTEKLKNAETLSMIFDYASMRAPRRSWEAVDITLLDKWRLSLRTATEKKDAASCGGLCITTLRLSSSSHCDAVIIFYRGDDGQRTHVSILNARDVSRPRARTFYWSRTRNVHILEQRIPIDPTNLPRVREEIIHRLNSIR